MFGSTKAKSVKKLTKQYKKMMAEARDIQRSGDIKLYSQKIAEAEQIAVQIQGASQPGQGG